MATGHAQPPSHGTLKVPGARLRFEVHGAGEPVVLIMGFGMPGAAWRNQVPTLAARHRVVHFDNRGAGATESTAGAYSMGLFAQDTLALMDHLGMQRAHVVGVSMGGMIAQELALRARPRVRSLTLIATHAGGLRAVLPPRGGLSLFFGALRGKGPKARLEAVERLLFPEEYLATCDRAWLRGVLAQDFGHPPRRAMRWSQLAAVLRHRAGHRLRRLDGLPTLIVRAGRDRLIAPEESDRLARLLPHAQLLRYDDAGHGIIRQCAARLSADLLAHFARAR